MTTFTDIKKVMQRQGKVIRGDIQREEDIYLNKNLLQNTRVEAKIMKNKFIIIGSILLFLCACFSGCNQISEVFLKDEDRVLGAWNSDEGILMEVPIPTVIVFFANGSFEINIEIGTGDVSLKNGVWGINNGILSLEMPDDIPLTTFTYVFSNDSKTLTLTEVEGSRSFILNKQQGI
jgi:hypothetical protein